MDHYFLFFQKKSLPTGGAQILFALQGNHKFISPKKNDSSSILHFIDKNKLIRHEDFDKNVKTENRKIYLFEVNSTQPSPESFYLDAESVKVNWYMFPKAASLLENSSSKVILQLAVQYIAAGGVDESVIAADYDEAFIRDLLDKL